jgi:hypothetical protein
MFYWIKIHKISGYGECQYEIFTTHLANFIHISNRICPGKSLPVIDEKSVAEKVALTNAAGEKIYQNINNLG